MRPEQKTDQARLKVPKLALDGVLLIDKPLGLSSNDVLIRAKGMLRAKKAGHTGTLDPLATGLLPVCFGEATKFSQDLLDADKTYEATMRLGVRTETGDAEGAALSTRPVTVDLAQIDAALARFTGPIAQIPPMYSALKRDGKPLYEYARSGVVIEREARPVVIHALTRLSDQTLLDTQEEVRFRVTCSKGTYVRTLAEDIGEALGCGAHLTALRRVGVATLSIEDAVTLDALQLQVDAARADGAAFDVLPRLQPVDALLQGLPPVFLDDGLATRFLHGQRLRLPLSVASSTPSAVPSDYAGVVRVYVDKPADRVRLLGTAHWDAGLLAPARLVAQAA